MNLQLQLRDVFYFFLKSVILIGISNTLSAETNVLASCGYTDQEVRCLDFVETEVSAMSCGFNQDGESCITSVYYNDVESTITVSMACNINGVLGSTASVVFDCTGNVLQECYGFSFSFSCPVGDGLNFAPGREIFNCDEDAVLCESDGADVTVCDDFDRYNLGSVSPQAGGIFSPFSSTSGDGRVVNDPTLSGNRSLWISSGTDIDFNVGENITESQVARIEFAMYIPAGGSGEWGLETNNTNYGLRLVFNSSTVAVYSQQNLVTSTTTGATDRWVDVALIFQPQQNEIELWWDNVYLARLTNYQSNQITDLNFYGIDGSNSTSYYIDDICYREWTPPTSCPAQYDPVCVNDVVYPHPCDAARLGYTDKEWIAGECGVPGCTTLSFPSNGAVDIPSDVIIRWPAADDAESYQLAVGTSSGGGEIVNYINVGNTLSYPLTSLPASTVIYVTVTPTNSVGSANDCLQSRFTVESPVLIPSCTNLFFPSAGAIDIETEVTVRWTAASNATAYFVEVQVGGTIIEAVQLGDVTSYSLTSLPEGSEICVTITPSNSMVSAADCATVCFVTEANADLACTTITAPANNAQDVSTTVNITWEQVADATGYIFSATDAQGQSIVSQRDLGLTTNYVATDLPAGTFICVTVTPYNDITSAAACTPSCFMTAMTTSTEEIAETEMILYPTVSSDYVVIDNQQGGEVDAVEIISTSGQVIQSHRTYTLGQTLSIHSLAKGLYYARVRDGGEVTTYRFVKI